MFFSAAAEGRVCDVSNVFIKNAPFLSEFLPEPLLAKQLILLACGYSGYIISFNEQKLT